MLFPESWNDIPWRHKALFFPINYANSKEALMLISIPANR